MSAQPKTMHIPKVVDGHIRHLQRRVNIAEAEVRRLRLENERLQALLAGIVPEETTCSHLPAAHRDSD